MKKLFLVVIGLVLMAGTIFSPSTSWSFTPDNEVSFLSEHVPPGDLCILNNKIIQATNQNLSALETNKINVNNDFDPMDVFQPATHEQLGVCSSNLSLFTSSIDNPGHDLIARGIFRKRVYPLLC